METMMLVLGKASSSHTLGLALEGLTLEVMSSSTREERVRMKQMLEDLSTNKSEMLDSAKLRRRVRRLVETLDVKIEAKAAAVAAVKVTTKRTAKESAACPLGMVDAIDALRGVRKPCELEAVLNNLRLPAKVDGHHNCEFLTNRDHLRETLDLLSNDMSLTTAVLRKRIKKLRYGLLPEPLKQVKNSMSVVKKNPPPHAKNTTSTTNSNSNSNTANKNYNDSIPSTVPPHKSADVVLAELQAANTGEAVELALSGFTEVSLTAAGVAETAAKLFVALGALLEPGHVCGELNAKARRKVKRGLDLLANASTQVAVPVAATMAPAMKRQRVSFPAADVAAATAKPVTSASLQEIHSAFQTALQHASLPDVEAALALVADISPEEACCAGALIALLVGLAKNGTEGLTFNSALRRRITRAADSLKAAAAVSLSSSTFSSSSSSFSANTSSSTIIIHNPPPGRDLAPTIAAVGASKDNAALMSALADVSRGDGNVTTRRKLVRLLGQLERQGGLCDCAVQLTDKTRARCSLVIQLLQPVSNSGAKVVAADEAAHHDLLSGPTARTSMQGASSKPPTPHVIFVGQLPFDCTTKDLEALLQTAELGGPAKVRLLTNESTGAPRGTAFVEVESAEDQHKCLSLHHSIVRGRKINIEKSCGGSNPERRAQKLAEQRLAQQAALHQKIVLIVDQYSARGVLPPREQLGSVVQDRLFAYSPAHVQAVLANYERAISSSNQAAGLSSATLQAALDRTMDSFDRKLLRTAGSAVPITKRRRNDADADDYSGRDEDGEGSAPELAIKRVKEERETCTTRC